LAKRRRPRLAALVAKESSSIKKSILPITVVGSLLWITVFTAAIFKRMAAKDRAPNQKTREVASGKSGWKSAVGVAVPSTEVSKPTYTANTLAESPNQKLL
jgi:hypothetical protein